MRSDPLTQIKYERGDYVRSNIFDFHFDNYMVVSRTCADNVICVLPFTIVMDENRAPIGIRRIFSLAVDDVLFRKTDIVPADPAIIGLVKLKGIILPTLEGAKWV